MAKTSGLGGIVKVMDASSTLQIISNDTTNWALTSPRATQDVTGVDKSAHETLLLLADYTITLNGVFNSSGTGGGSDTANSHAVFSTIPSTSVIRGTSILPIGGSTPVMAVNCVLTDYQITRANTGELTWQVPGQLADGSVPTWA